LVDHCRDAPTGRIGSSWLRASLPSARSSQHQDRRRRHRLAGFINPLYGRRTGALDAGRSATETVVELTAADEGRDNRQLHAMDRQGRFAA